MNKYSPQTLKGYEHKSSSNLSLITAGLPSGSNMTSRLIPPSSTTRPNQYFNQNRATDTQPMSFSSSKSDTDQSITFSHRTISDTYLNLSRKDIDELLTALHTLAQYVHTDMDNQSHLLTVPHSKSINQTIETNRRRSLQCYHNYGSDIQPKQIFYYSRPCQPIKNLPSPLPLPSYILDQLISIDQNELIANVQMLPQHAHSFQIVQNNQIHSLMSIDSLNTKDRLRTVSKPSPLRKRNHDQTFSMGDQLILKKIDAATQWSLPISAPTPSTCQNVQLPESVQTNSANLTELTPSKTTIATNNSAVHPSCITNRMS